jgi:hypothetical protein
MFNKMKKKVNKYHTPVYLEHKSSEIRESDIKLKDKKFVFTSWGLVEGVVTKQRIDRESGIPQYKLDIKIDKNNTKVDYNFWYTADQMFKSKFTAVVSELLRPSKVKQINDPEVINANK